ncbi:hypothetical protein T459_20482 [Capsicum annuum]|uniref:Ubiquitin-like protease family profile domain-containing protein n=1 Tax=Capsicum annuum TaxID=4072 RepID=A0A2G2Z4K9_CAPAN|nr:hypothetical protein T459_20482 [Capsicum annuum]
MLNKGSTLCKAPRDDKSDSWTDFRPIIVIDVAALKSLYGGTMLTASTLDPGEAEDNEHGKEESFNGDDPNGIALPSKNWSKPSALIVTLKSCFGKYLDLPEDNNARFQMNIVYDLLKASVLWARDVNNNISFDLINLSEDLEAWAFEVIPYLRQQVNYQEEVSYSRILRWLSAKIDKNAKFLDLFNPPPRKHECSSCKCQDYKAKHDGVINVINALTASVKEITSKRAVIPSKRISYSDPPLEIKAAKRRRKDTSKASSIIKKSKFATPLSLSCTDVQCAMAIKEQHEMKKVDVIATAEEHNMTVDNPSTASKDEEKVEPVSLGEWKNYTFEGFNISDEAPKKLIQLINDYSEWIADGLLKHHAGRKQNDERYNVNELSLGFDMFDFFVAHPETKNWFYLMSQSQTCWNDEHIDVIFYYLQKKAKLQTQEQYRYTTDNYLYKVYINNAYDRYCQQQPEVFRNEECLINIIKERRIRVYDSMSRRRRSEPSSEIQKLAKILPTYLDMSSFLDQKVHTDWSTIEAYRDKMANPFDVQYVDGIAQQTIGSLDCGPFVAEYLSDGLQVPNNRIDAGLCRKRYATLLWKYGEAKAQKPYATDVKAPRRPKPNSIALDEEQLVHID